MAYAAETDVEALLAKWPITTATQPNSTQTALLIEQVDDRIDALLAGHGIVVPYVAGSGNGEAAFAGFLKATCAQGAAVLVLASMFPDQDGGDHGSLATLKELFEAALAQLADGTVIPQVVMAAVAVHPSSFNTRSPDDDEHMGDRADPAFKRSRAAEW